MRPIVLALAGSALALAAGCGDGDDAVRSGPPAGELTVADALAVEDGTEVRVAGHLIALPDGTATLCGGAVMESAPPRCGDPALAVDGLTEPAELPGARSVGGWVEGDVVLEGVVDGGRLRLT
jgi:hypothetical protein